MHRVLPDIKGNALRQRKVFSDDGKKEDLYRNFPRFYPGCIENLFLMFCFLSSDRHLLRVDGRTIAAFRLHTIKNAS